MPRSNIVICIAVFTACFLLGSPVFPQNTKAAKGPAAGSSKGTTITMEEVNKAAINEMDRVELKHLQAEAAYTRSKHMALEHALDHVIENKVIEAEAASQGMRAQALLDKELAGKVKEPALEDLDAHYPPNSRPTGDTRDKMFACMQHYLETENYNKAKAGYVAQLKKKYAVTENLKPRGVSDIETVINEELQGGSSASESASNSTALRNQQAPGGPGIRK